MKPSTFTYFLAWIIVSAIYAFLIMPFFYDNIPKEIFIPVFFFVGIFISWTATYTANRIMGQDVDVEDSLKEGFIRRVIHISLMIFVALAVIHIFLKLL